MRVSTQQVYDAGLRGIRNAQTEVKRTQEQVATGKRLLSPADDPASAALALRVTVDISRSQQYQRNSDIANRDLRQQEVEIESVETVLFRLRELTISAGNPTLGAPERRLLATELDGLTEQLRSVGNARQATGEYLFAGFQGRDPAFETRPGGVIEYAGDSGQREIQVGNGIDIAVRDNGRALFVDVPAANKTFQTELGSANTGSGDIDVGRIVDQAAYDAVYPDDLVIQFSTTVPGQIDVLRRNATTGTSAALVPPVSFSYSAGSPINVGGVEVRVSGTPAAGDEFIVKASTTQSLFTTVQRLSMALRSSPDTPAGAVERDAAIAETLGNLNLAEIHVFTSRADLGSRLQLLDTVREELQQTELVNKQLLSEVSDLDYNEAISRLTFQSFVLEAAQKSLARVSNISLFDYL
ncbi:MAG: flagellar hook-associated protein FlgL [Gammaproteobacteria bacterium]